MSKRAIKLVLSHKTLSAITCALISAMLSTSLSANTAPTQDTRAKDKAIKESPWLFTPTVSSDPKVGTSVGALAAYLHTFDSDSPASMFGVAGSYSSTDSIVGGVFARTYFDHDTQRLIGFLGGGNIKNDYTDFLGTGLPASTTDDLSIFVVKYLHQIQGDWFAGVQAANTNYTLSGDDDFSQAILDKVGLVGFDSVGVGLAAQYDSRDNQNSPTSGSSIEINNLAYRETFGGDTSFDTYNVHIKSFFAHGEQNVLALKLSGRWTSDAPSSGYSSINLRGYVRGQYLAPHMTSFEIEERYWLYKRWSGTVFTGIACLYGGNSECSDSSNLYPTIGAGISYAIKPEEKMVVSVDLAYGKADNYGFYMRFGHAF